MRATATKVESTDRRTIVTIGRRGPGEIQLMQTHSTVEDVLKGSM